MSRTPVIPVSSTPGPMSRPDGVTCRPEATRLGCGESLISARLRAHDRSPIRKSTVSSLEPDDSQANQVGVLTMDDPETSDARLDAQPDEQAEREPRSAATLAALVVGMMAAAVYRKGGFYPSDAFGVAVVSGVVAVLALVRFRDRASAVVALAVGGLAVWWMIRSVLAHHPAAFFPLGATLLGFLGAFVVVKALHDRDRGRVRPGGGDRLGRHGDGGFGGCAVAHLPTGAAHRSLLAAVDSAHPPRRCRRDVRRRSRPGPRRGSRGTGGRRRAVLAACRPDRHPEPLGPAGRGVRSVLRPVRALASRRLAPGHGCGGGMHRRGIGVLPPRSVRRLRSLSARPRSRPPSAPAIAVLPRSRPWAAAAAVLMLLVVAATVIAVLRPPGVTGPAEPVDQGQTLAWSAAARAGALRSSPGPAPRRSRVDSAGRLRPGLNPDTVLTIGRTAGSSRSCCSSGAVGAAGGPSAAGTCWRRAPPAPPSRSSCAGVVDVDWELPAVGHSRRMRGRAWRRRRPLRPSRRRPPGFRRGASDAGRRRPGRPRAGVAHDRHTDLGRFVREAAGGGRGRRASRPTRRHHPDTAAPARYILKGPDVTDPFMLDVAGTLLHLHERGHERYERARSGRDRDRALGQGRRRVAATAQVGQGRPHVGARRPSGGGRVGPVLHGAPARGLRRRLTASALPSPRRRPVRSSPPPHPSSASSIIAVRSIRVSSSTDRVS